MSKNTLPNKTTLKFHQRVKRMRRARQLVSPRCCGGLPAWSPPWRGGKPSTSSAPPLGGATVVAENKWRAYGATSFSTQSGSVPIYITLVLLLMLTSSAIILSGILSRQIRTSQDIISSERSFYAANSGLEEALYKLVQFNLGGSAGTIEDVNGTLEYPGEGDAVYTTKATLILNPSQTQSRPCISSTGEYNGQERRIDIHSPDDEC